MSLGHVRLRDRAEKVFCVKVRSAQTARTSSCRNVPVMVGGGAAVRCEVSVASYSRVSGSGILLRIAKNDGIQLIQNIGISGAKLSGEQRA